MSRLIALFIASVVLSACAPSTGKVTSFLREGLESPHRSVALRTDERRKAFWYGAVATLTKAEKAKPVVAAKAEKNPRPNLLQRLMARLEKGDAPRIKSHDRHAERVSASHKIPKRARDDSSDLAALPTPTPAPKTASAPSVLKAVARAKPGEIVAVQKGRHTTAQVKLLESYQSATGETCRRYALYDAPEKSGQVHTACRDADRQQWVALRGGVVETLSPLVNSPPVATALTLPGETRDAE